jgi:hypothetical protein
MKKTIDGEAWVYVVVQNPGRNEVFFGLHDRETDVSYIPAFQTKEEAQGCLLHLPTERGNKYEVQAVMFEDLKDNAFGNGFLVFILNEDGKILEKVFPEPASGHAH